MKINLGIIKPGKSLKGILDIFGKELRFEDGLIKRVNVLALLRAPDDSICAIAGANIVTDGGDRYYATRAAGESAYFTVAGMNLGTGVTTPGKGDTACTTRASAGDKAIDSTYPKTNDTDGDNTGAGVDIITWRVSYTTAEANITSIAELAIVNNLTTPTNCVCHAKFATVFDKTSNDTLKVFVNHTFNGV